MNGLLEWLKQRFPWKELGWAEIDETFHRFAILKAKRFNIYLHRLDAPVLSPDCHDHPWWFFTILLWPGYMEDLGDGLKRRWPLTIHFRSIKHKHRVITPFGVSWSLIITGRKSNDWRFQKCN